MVAGEYYGVYARGFTYDVGSMDTSSYYLDTLLIQVALDTTAPWDNYIRAGGDYFRLNSDGTLESYATFIVDFSGAKQ